MICTTTEQMQRVARAGAAKMDTAGYQYRPVEVVPGWFEVTLPAEFSKSGDTVTYNVALLGDGQDCTCAFHKANRHLPGVTCKHCEYVRHEEESIAAFEEAEEARAEFFEFAMSNERGFGS